MIIDVLKQLGTLGQGTDSDGCDRLNYKYTSMLMLALCFLVTTRQYVGDAIECWTPAHFNSQWNTYSNNYCWISNTFYLTLDSHHKAEFDGKSERPILYYQWTPFILLMQAFMFIFPHLIWRALYTSAAIDFDAITSCATTFETIIDAQAWRQTVARLARHIDRYLELQTPLRNKRVGLMSKLPECFCFGRRYGNYLTLSYAMVKLMFIINILLQFECLRVWLGNEYTTYGIHVLEMMLTHGSMRHSELVIFPRVTWCSVHVRSIEKVNTYNMHCVLPINLFNEVVFLIVWYWLALIFAVNIAYCYPWIINCLCTNDVNGFLKKHLRSAGKLTEKSERIRFRRFTTGYLKSDGALIIRLLSYNTSAIFISDLIEELFELHGEKQPSFREMLPSDNHHDTDYHKVPCGLESLTFEASRTMPPNYAQYIVQSTANSPCTTQRSTEKHGFPE